MGDTVFVFPDRHSPWTGLASELVDTAPAFAAEMERCDRAFSEFVEWSVLDVVQGRMPPARAESVDVDGPVVFALAASLAALWRSVGTRPDAVLGEAQGEIAAAYVAGILPLRDAARVLTVGRAAAKVITAETTADGDVEARWQAIRGSLSGMRPRASGVVFISTVTGAALDASILDGEYWYANLRQPPLLEDALRWSYGHGYRTFLESCPQPRLTASIHDSLSDLGCDCIVR